MKTRTALIAFCVAAATAAGAQSVEMNQGHLSALDANSDGAVSGAEYSSFVTYSFETMDTDGNALLSSAEVEAHLAGKSFGQLDKNGDGAVSADEFSQSMSADFEAADKDGNGVLN